MAKKTEKKIRLQFKGTDAFPVYHAHPNWKDGDIREVNEDTAEYLLEHFEDHFIDLDAVKPEPEKPKDEDDELGAEQLWDAEVAASRAFAGFVWSNKQVPPFNMVDLYPPDAFNT